MPKKIKDPFVAHNKKIFVRASLIMSPLILIADGLPVHFFGNGGIAYLTLSVAIDWCQKEMECCRRAERKKYESIIEALKQRLEEQETLR